MASAVRQRYAMATGGGPSTDTSAKTTPRFAKGGKVKAKFVKGAKTK